jgi:hypothetical protein
MKLFSRGSIPFCFEGNFEYPTYGSYNIFVLIFFVIHIETLCIIDSIM